MNAIIKDLALDEIVDFLSDQIKKIDLLDGSATPVVKKTINIPNSKVSISKDLSSSTTSSKLTLTITIDGSDFPVVYEGVLTPISIKTISVYDNVVGSNPMFSVTYTNALQLNTNEDQVIINVDVVSQS